MRLLRTLVFDVVMFSAILSRNTFLVNASWALVLLGYSMMIVGVFGIYLSEDAQTKLVNHYRSKFLKYYEYLSDAAYVILFAGLGYFVVASIIFTAAIFRAAGIEHFTEKEKLCQNDSQ